MLKLTNSIYAGSYHHLR